MPPLLVPFIAQLLLAGAAFLVAPRVARRPKRIWASACTAALAAMLFWPLMRFFPVQPINLFGAPVIACIELTGLAIPAVLLFAVAARHVPKQSDRRAILLLTAVAALYFVKAGWWMLAPPLELSRPTRIGDHGVCIQTTGYTCVAASMVTMLRARGIHADESEMAALAYTQVGGGATDSRALWALQTKLRGTAVRPRYAKLSIAALIAAPKPCLVQLDWGFFVSHMVPVLSATSSEVIIGDPLRGRRILSTADFAREWKGNAITLEPARSDLVGTAWPRPAHLVSCGP